MQRGPWRRRAVEGAENRFYAAVRSPAECWPAPDWRLPGGCARAFFGADFGTRRRADFEHVLILIWGDKRQWSKL